MEFHEKHVSIQKLLLSSANKGGCSYAQMFANISKYLHSKPPKKNTQLCNMLSQKHFGALRMAYLGMLWLHYLLFFVVSWPPESRPGETLQQLLLVVRIQEQTKDYKHLAQLPSLKLAAKAPKKIDGWRTFLLEAFRPIFRGFCCWF